MRVLLGLLAALASSVAVHAADSNTFTYRLTLPDGTPGVIRARVEKSGDRHSVTCDYSVSQEREMDLPDMPLGSWHGTGVEKGDRDAVRSLCLDHYDDHLPPN
jgi:hypothetical protein